MTGGKVRQYPYFVRLFHTSTPLRSVELRMKKESRDLVASTGHLWKFKKDVSPHFKKRDPLCEPLPSNPGLYIEVGGRMVCDGPRD